MKMNTAKIYLDLLLKILAIALVGLCVLASCAEINKRLDEQTQAEQQYIADYQAELKETQAKEDTP